MSDMNKALGNEGGPWPLVVKGRTWNLNYPDEATLGRFVKRCKRLALEALDLAREVMSPDGFAAMSAAVNAEIGVKRLYEWGGQRCQEALFNTDGLAHFLWLLLRPNHPDLTEKDAARVVADSLAERPEVRDADGRVTGNPYVVQTILDMAAPGESRPPARAANP